MYLFTPFGVIFVWSKSPLEIPMVSEAIRIEISRSLFEG